MIISEILVVILMICCAMLFIILCLYLYLIYKRKKEQRKSKEISLYIQRNESDWYNYIVLNQTQKQTSHERKSRDAIDRMFDSFMEKMEDREIRERASSYAALNMKEYYIKQFKSRDAEVRLNALQRAAVMELDFLFPYIERSLKNVAIYSVEEYVVMLKIAANYNRNLFLAHMHKPRMLLEDADFQRILSNIEESYCEYFKDHYDELPIRLQLAFLDYLCVKADLHRTYLSLFERLLASECKEIRIRALRAVSSFGAISSLANYGSFMQSPHWEERLVLAEILRFVMEEEAYNCLYRLAHDPHAEVRKQAARSLMKKPRGKAVLLQIIGSEKEMEAVKTTEEVMNQEE